MSDFISHIVDDAFGRRPRSSEHSAAATGDPMSPPLVAFDRHLSGEAWEEDETADEGIASSHASQALEDTSTVERTTPPPDRHPVPERMETALPPGPFRPPEHSAPPVRLSAATGKQGEIREPSKAAGRGAVIATGGPPPVKTGANGNEQKQMEVEGTGDFANHDDGPSALDADEAYRILPRKTAIPTGAPVPGEEEKIPGFAIPASQSPQSSPKAQRTQQPSREDNGAGPVDNTAAPHPSQRTARSGLFQLREENASWSHGHPTRPEVLGPGTPQRQPLVCIGQVDIIVETPPDPSAEASAVSAGAERAFDSGASFMRRL